MRRTLGCWLVAVSLTTLVAPSAAFAEDPEAASLIERGLDLRQAQRDAEALTLFEKAQAISPSPRGEAQVALAEQALGRWLAAERDLAAALSATADPWIESRRPILERAMAVIASHLGDVEIAGATAGAFYVDGVRVDPHDRSGPVARLRLEAGRRTVEVRAPGYYPVSRVLDVLPGDVVRIEVAQHPLLGEEAPLPTPSVKAPQVGSEHAGRSQRLAAWITAGAAGALVATGVAGLIERSVAVSDFNGASACTNPAHPNALPSECSGWLSDGTTGQDLEIVGFVGAGVAAVVAVVLFATAPSAKSHAAGLLEPCGPTRSGLSCGLTVDF